MRVNWKVHRLIMSEWYSSRGILFALHSTGIWQLKGDPKEKNSDVTWKWTKSGILILSNTRRRAKESLEDDPTSERPVTATVEENIDRVQYMGKNERVLAINQIVNVLRIDHDTVKNIQHNALDMIKVSARWGPCVLAPDQNRPKLITSEENLILFEADTAGRFPWMFLNLGWVLASSLWARGQRKVASSGSTPPHLLQRSQDRFICKRSDHLSLLVVRKTLPLLTIFKRITPSM